VAELADVSNKERLCDGSLARKAWDVGGVVDPAEESDGILLGEVQRVEGQLPLWPGLRNRHIAINAQQAVDLLLQPSNVGLAGGKEPDVQALVNVLGIQLGVVPINV
jgi:hypothetical protein